MRYVALIETEERFKKTFKMGYRREILKNLKSKGTRDAKLRIEITSGREAGRWDKERTEVGGASVRGMLRFSRRMVYSWVEI